MIACGLYGGNLFDFHKVKLSYIYGGKLSVIYIFCCSLLKCVLCLHCVLFQSVWGVMCHGFAGGCVHCLSGQCVNYLQIEFRCMLVELESVGITGGIIQCLQEVCLWLLSDSIQYLQPYISSSDTFMWFTHVDY